MAGPPGAVIVGGNDVSYGSRPKDAKNWKEKVLAEVGRRLDPTRTHFLGKRPYEDCKKVLQVLSLHTYLSYPFVLSWSMLESMASGCLVLGNDTASVREAVRDGESGFLVRPLNHQALAQSVGAALSLSQPQVHAIRVQATRQIAERWPRGRGRWALEEVLAESGQRHS